MKLSIPPVVQNPHTNQRTITATVSITENCDDNNDDQLFQTPNATLLRDDEFGTPLNEMPSVSGMHMTQSPTYYSIASSKKSHSSSSVSQLCDSSSESETADDSGLDENYHTPRVAKIKSMENLSILEMEFHKASQELDRNSPRRLKLLAEQEHLPKMKSLNNLCAETFSDQQVLEEFERMREHSLEEKQRFHFQQRKSSSSSTHSGKIFLKNKVGNAKFIGGDDSADATTIINATTKPIFRHPVPHPIQKMPSMGTIPDVVTERIEPDPFLTPTSCRKPQFPFVTQSAEKPTPPSYVDRLLGSDLVDGPGDVHHSQRSLKEFYTQDRLSRLVTEPATFMPRSQFERAYKRSTLKSSTPLRQSFSVSQQTHDTQQPHQQAPSQQYTLAPPQPLLMRPHSTNAAYDLMRFVDTPRSYRLQMSQIFHFTYAFCILLRSICFTNNSASRSQHSSHICVKKNPITDHSLQFIHN